VKELIRIAFKGKRYDGHALDLSALDELVRFQKIVTETAKALWREANQDCERLPPHFEDNIRLCLRRIEDRAPEGYREIGRSGARRLDSQCGRSRDEFRRAATSTELAE
jgi:hypothetical protein